MISALGMLLLLGVPACFASTMGSESVSVGSATPISSTLYFSSPVYLSPGSLIRARGSGGTLTSVSSITASGFFGHGGSLTNVALLPSTQTFSGANIFSSSVIVTSGGREIYFSTSSITKNISISPQGEIIFYPKLHTSTKTTIGQASTTAGTFGPCIAGSTISLVTSGGRVELSFHGTLSNDGGPSAQPWQVAFLQDGSFVGGMGPTTGIGVFFPGSSLIVGAQWTTHFNYLIDTLPSGSHSYCISMRSAGSGTTTLLNDATIGNQFYAIGIK